MPLKYECLCPCGSPDPQENNCGSATRVDCKSTTPRLGDYKSPKTKITNTRGQWIRRSLRTKQKYPKGSALSFSSINKYYQIVPQKQKIRSRSFTQLFSNNLKLFSNDFEIVHEQLIYRPWTSPYVLKSICKYFIPLSNSFSKQKTFLFLIPQKIS